MRKKCEEWAGKDDGMIPIAIYKCKIMKCFCICHLPYDSSGTNLMIFDNSLSLSYKECHHDIAWNLDLSIHKRLVKFRQGHNIQTLASKVSEMIGEQEQNKVWILMIIARSVAVRLLIDTCKYDVNAMLYHYVIGMK